LWNAAARARAALGQFALNFETSELDERVRVIAGRATMPTSGSPPRSSMKLRKAEAEAIDAYDHALSIDPENSTHCSIAGRSATRMAISRRPPNTSAALSSGSKNALAHFNLGSVLEETGRPEAARSISARPSAFSRTIPMPTTKTNLAFVCDKLGAYAEAHRHWQAYITLDPLAPGAAMPANASLLPRRQRRAVAHKGEQRLR